MRCDYAHDDGVYVLGALAPSERAAYEHHLAGCPACRQAVAEIAVLPGLLGRLDPAAFEQVAEPSQASAQLSTLVTAAGTARRRGRRVRRWQTAGAALAAACLAIAVGFGVGWMGAGGASESPEALSSVRGAPRSPDVSETSSLLRLTAMQPVRSGTPVGAEIGLVGREWGTEVTMRCWYDANGADGDVYTFQLVAYGPDGAQEQVGSWAVGPGAEVTFSGGTRFTRADLDRLELIREDGNPVLAYQVD